jgi:hypothetical protein
MMQTANACFLSCLFIETFSDNVDSLQQIVSSENNVKNKLLSLRIMSTDTPTWHALSLKKGTCKRLIVGTFRSLTSLLETSFFILYFWAHIRWTCHSFRWWLQDILHNYEHVITQQLYQLWKVRSPCSLSPRIVLTSCLCPRDEVAFLWNQFNTPRLIIINCLLIRTILRKTFV